MVEPYSHSLKISIMKLKSFIFPILAFAFCCFVIYTIYAANTGKDFIFFHLIKQIPYGDKLGHFMLIGSLTFLLNMALKIKKIKLASLSILLGSLIIFTVISLEEFSQMFLANRTFDLVDLFFNYLGIFVFGRFAEYFGKPKE